MSRHKFYRRSPYIEKRKPNIIYCAFDAGHLLLSFLLPLLLLSLQLPLVLWIPGRVRE
jgi:hypothetical protein